MPLVTGLWCGRDVTGGRWAVTPPDAGWSLPGVGYHSSAPLLGLLQRTVWIRGKIHHEGLAHVIMKAENLPSASWRPSKAAGVVRSKSKGL